MEIPNYDFKEDENTNFKQLLKYMPDKPFRMLICGNSGSGKTNLLFHTLMKPLVYYDQIHLYGKNLEQEKYKHMIKTMEDISRQVGYDIIHYNNDEIKPVDSMDSDTQKIVIFDDFICDKNQKPLVDYFIQGRHKNCSVIYLSQSFYRTPKDIINQSIVQSINRLMYPIAGINLNYRKGQRQQTYLALVFNSNKVIKTSCAA